MPRLKRTVLVTGARSGIGKAVAENLLHQGHAVIGTARDADALSRTVPGIHALQLDLADLVGLPHRIGALLERHPTLDAAVLCAGMGRFGSVEEFSYAQIEALMTVNLTSQMFMTRALLPHLKAKPASDLVFIGSEAALKGARKGAVYCASKFAVRGFTQALREECGKSGVRICLVNPGMVKTAFFEPLSFEPGDHASNYLLPEDVAEAVAYVLNTRPHIVIDEINLNPLNKVVKFKRL